MLPAYRDGWNHVERAIAAGVAPPAFAELSRGSSDVREHVAPAPAIDLHLKPLMGGAVTAARHLGPSRVSLQVPQKQEGMRNKVRWNTLAPGAHPLRRAAAW